MEPLRYRDAPARKAAILALLQTTGYLTIGEVAAHLSISEMTARRDLRKLAEDGTVDAVRGGIRLPSGAASIPTEYEHRLSAEASAKAAIGRAAAALIKKNDVVAIDAGTTTYQVAQALPDSFVGTVVTHSIPVIDLLAARPSRRVIALGGDVFRPSKALVGSMTSDNAQGLRVSTFFLGAGGVDERGIYALADVERSVKDTLMDIAHRVVLVIDHRKFTSAAPVLICDWSRIDAIVCDATPPTELAAVLATAGVKVQVVTGF
jgi:DeoR/GlpR family transcriptional regulator of sugar metabolism